MGTPAGVPISVFRDYEYRRAYHALGRERKSDYEAAQDNRMLSKADNLISNLDYRLKTAYGR